MTCVKLHTDSSLAEASDDPSVGSSSPVAGRDAVVTELLFSSSALRT